MAITKEDLFEGMYKSTGAFPKAERITELDLDLIDDLFSFEHPFDKSYKRSDGIEDLTRQIRDSGVLVPITVRKEGNGRYECLASAVSISPSRWIPPVSRIGIAIIISFLICFSVRPVFLDTCPSATFDVMAAIKSPSKFIVSSLLVRPAVSGRSYVAKQLSLFILNHFP